MKTKNILTLTLLAGICLPAVAQYDIIDSVAFKDQRIDVGANRTFSREESSAAVSIITNKDVNRRGGRNIGNNIIGQGNGLVSLQGAGLYTVANPTFYVRGLQSLSGSTPLILVDGVERDINNVIADDVESVSILKDAAATALYGYKGANGAILVTTKHGAYNTKSISFSYDHEFQWLTNKPEFVDAATYASAVNEAYRNQGGTAPYSEAVLESYRSNANPLYYPNVNWVDETFRDVAHMNRFNLTFKGGGQKFRYYTDVNLMTTKGHIADPKAANASYNTQDKYTRGTMRSNLDIDLTDKTILHTHIYGVLTEQSEPGTPGSVNDTLWYMVHRVPSNAFPIQIANGIWGGNATYTTMNPYAQATNAAYYKKHQRALYADMQIDQDLSGFVEGLSAKAQIGYDTWSNVYEDHTKTYRYGSYSVANFTGGVVDPANATLTTDGEESNMGVGANNNQWVRRFIFNASLDYDRVFADKHDFYSQLKWDYEFNDVTGTNTSIYRMNATSWTHYSYDKRYNLDLALVLSGTNRLAKGSKWAFSPTASASWNLHNEAFLKDNEMIDFLKLRGSVGMQQLDVLPGSNVWTYYDQFYTMNATLYNFYSTMGSYFGNTFITQAATQSLGREHAMKYNIGLDATLFKGLNASVDFYYQHRYDIWCSTSGYYSAVFALDAPYENVGIVNSKGLEVSLDYSKQVGDWAFNLGGTFNMNKNTIEEQAEEPRLYENLVRTGKPLNSIFGYVANGFFQTSDDVNGDGSISAAEMSQLGYPVQTFTTVYPGDVRYQDINGDGVIDANDQTKIGKSNACPEIIYTAHVGLGWKGFGIYAQFQGVAEYSGTLNTNGMYRSAVATNTLSKYLYENSWSNERGNTANPKFPRLSPTSNANNDLTNSLIVFDRSYFKLRNVEVFYNFPASALKSLKVVSALKIYVKGTDLFTIDNLESGDAGYYGTNQPLTRNIQVGAAITF